MADQFESHQTGLSSPAADAAAIAPDDGNDLPGGACRGIYVGVGGDIALVTTRGSAVTFAAVPSGSVLPVRAARVKSAGTSASSLVALY